uniref:Pectinesterase inhibitor domain-containing protein n=1 Tax=Opuntia streptacantha TaxID=393608 RepID=A0A7C8Z6Q9_OPUST
MARYTVPLLLLSLSILLLSGGANSCRRCSRARSFIINTCRATQYPKSCERALSGYLNSTYPSHQQLAQVALRVSLTRAKFARAYLVKLASKYKGSHGPEYQALGECLDQINDSVVQLRQSLMELQTYSQEGVLDSFMWHMSNAKTWASTALTDQMDCVEAISTSRHGKQVKTGIKGRVTEVAQATSNALALLNRFIMQRRFVRGNHRP